MPSDHNALAAAAIIQLQQINLLLLPEKPGGFCHPAKVGRARTMIMVLVAELKQSIGIELVVGTSDAVNVVPFNRSVGE